MTECRCNTSNCHWRPKEERKQAERMMIGCSGSGSAVWSRARFSGSSANHLSGSGSRAASLVLDSGAARSQVYCRRLGSPGSWDSLSTLASSAAAWVAVAVQWSALVFSLEIGCRCADRKICSFAPLPSQNSTALSASMSALLSV